MEDPSSGLWIPENSQTHGTLIDENSPKGLHLNTKTKPHPKGQQAIVWTPNTKTSANRNTTLLTSREAAQSYIKPIHTPNTLLDPALSFRGTISSSIHQNTGTNPPNQETFTRHWSNPTQERETPQLKGTTTFPPAERRPKTQ